MTTIAAQNPARWETPVMNNAQSALLDRLREIVAEMPTCGAVNAAQQPVRAAPFAKAIERRAADGDALAEYARAKVHSAPTGSYSSLVKAERPDLTVEALVADAGADWASEFSDADRSAARERLGTVMAAHRHARDAAESVAVRHDRKIVAQVSGRRLAKGRPELTPAQAATMLDGLAARRADGG
jgi:hypothetical protein